VKKFRRSRCLGEIPFAADAWITVSGYSQQYIHLYSS